MHELERILKTNISDEKLRREWRRQLRTAARIARQHGNGYGTMLLADEVGMGKTYVALAVMARHIFESTKNDRKVLLVVPPNSVLATKWAQEIRSFNANYLKIGGWKQLRPMVVGDFWELVQNLHDYEDFAYERVSQDMKESFALALWEWRESRRRKRERLPTWEIYGNRHQYDVRYLDFCSRCSRKALQSFLDQEYLRNRSRFAQMLQALKDGETDHAYLKELLRAFSRQQDSMKPNIFIMGMGTFRRARSDSWNARLFSCYLAALSLKGCWSTTRTSVLKTLVKHSFVLPKELRDQGNKADWLQRLGGIDLWGMRAVAEEILRRPEWRAVVSDLAAGQVGSLKAMQDAVIQAKLTESGIGLAVIDEVHNWKNGTNGAERFQSQYAPRIPHKLIISATPFQLDQNELGRVFRYAGSAADNSCTVISELLGDGGAARRCLDESQRFLADWKAARQSDLLLLQDYMAGETGAAAPGQLLDRVLAEPSATSELRALVESIKRYRSSLDALRERLSQIMIRHVKPRDKRHYHAGAEFSAAGAPDYSKIRRMLYRIPGFTGAGDALLSFVAMRVDQLVRRETKPGAVNAHLLGGITSSNAAFRESNKALLKAHGLSSATRAYLDFFSHALESTPHAKVSATVERALTNYRAGLKTLIFCERLPTQKELIAELTRRITTEIFGNGTLEDVRERQYLLEEYQGVELLWSRSYLCALGKSENTLSSEEVTGSVADATAMLESLPRLNERQVLRVLDLILAKRLAQSPDGGRGLDFAQLLLGSRAALEEYLGLRRKEGEALDDEPEVSAASGVTHRHVETIFKSSNIWYAVPEHRTLHQTLWELIAAEVVELTGSEAGTTAATLFADLGLGLRKVLLRLDALTSVQRREKDSRTDAVMRMLREKASTPHLSPWSRTEHFLKVLTAAQGTIRRTEEPSHRQSLWRGVYLRERHLIFDDKPLVTGGIVSCLNGAVDATTRNSRCAAFNSPLLPDILVCTSIGSEGIDLHLYCDDVIHHDLPWNPAKLEQRTGRIDRVGSLAERQYDPAQPDRNRLNIGIPFLAHNYESFQYECLLGRAQKFEVLLGQPEFTADLEEEAIDDAGKEVVQEVASVAPEREGSPLKCLPEPIISYLKLDLSIPEAAGESASTSGS